MHFTIDEPHQHENPTIDVEPGVEQQCFQRLVGIAFWRGDSFDDGFENILDSASLSVFPSLAILLVVFSLNMLGDGLRDAIDPKLRGGE